MRQLLLLILGSLVFSLGCAKEPPPDPKKNPPRRLVKPGEGGKTPKLPPP